MEPSSTTSAPAGTGPGVDWPRIRSLVVGQAAVQAGSFALLIAMSWTAVQLGGHGAVTFVILASTLPRALMLLFGAYSRTLWAPVPSCCARPPPASPSWRPGP
ncbi:hypothetical protein ACFPN0_31980 [Kitasatospora cinereorecta]